MDRLSDAASMPRGTDPLEELNSAPETDIPLKRVRPNIVQAIRAFHVEELEAAAAALGQHFLYVNLSTAQNKQDVVDLIGEQFFLPAHYGKNFDAVYDCLTDPVYKSGPQLGFVVVLEHIPTTAKFDKEIREQLIDSFREISEYWSDRKIPFRCFYSFAVARSTKNGVSAANADDGDEGDNVEKMPTDKIVDVSPMALRMSSPFNAGYWLAN